MSHLTCYTEDPDGRTRPAVQCTNPACTYPNPHTHPHLIQRTEAERIEQYCEAMHDAYERAAAGAGWATNPASRKPWSDVPEPNKITMRAAVAHLVEIIDAERT